MIVNFLKERKNIFQIVVVSIILAFGVRFIGQGLSEILEFTKLENIYFGLIFVFIAALFFADSLFKQKYKEYTIRGFVIYDKSSNKIVKVPGYKYSEKLKKYFDASFAENKGIEMIWNKYKVYDYDNQPNIITGKALLYQATEYYFINSLSYHLIAYFNPQKFKSAKLNTFKRTDIPQILFENSFLDLFSKSMDERGAFIDICKDDNDNPHITLLSTEIDGHLFENFMLTLPKKCKVTKQSKTTLKIKNNRIELVFENEITGMETDISENFLKYYIGYKSDSEFIKYTMDTKIRIRFTLLSFFSSLGWKYFKWIDSFIEEYSNSFSERRFLDRINWGTIDNLINVTKKLDEDK